jgi:exosortase/archaeosortase
MRCCQKKSPYSTHLASAKSIINMKTATVLALVLATATAFNAPQFATRAVGAKKAPAKKAVAAVSVSSPSDYSHNVCSGQSMKATKFRTNAFI